MSLANLQAAVRRDMKWLDIAGPAWTRTPQGVLDVAIIGGGQCGLATAFGLKRQRVENILILDENAAGFEGPWDTYARMVTLRTPKQLTGLDFGMASLTFRAFWEAQHGAESWDALDKIPRRDWMSYLRWYREVLDLPVGNEARVTLVEPLGDGTHKLHLAVGAPLLARKVVFATGIQGGGEWHTPAFIREAVPKGLYMHSSEPIEPEAFAGKRIGILGSGASSFDNAFCALEAGAAQAHVFARREALPQVNPIRFMEGAGLIAHYSALSDAQKYEVMASFFARNQPPTNDTFSRAASFEGFALHLGSPWLSVAQESAGVRVETPKGSYFYDFLIISTGLVTDPALRPELGLVADDIVRWRDRYEAPPETANPAIDAHPYLGPHYELLPRQPDAAARLNGLFAFNYSGLISLGLTASALSGLKYGLPALLNGVTEQLFREDAPEIIADFLAYDEPEFTATWPSKEAAQ